MKNTPFTQKHIDLGAKMAEFAGYNMPISYTGINDEHAAVRNSVGVFDVSHMGEFILKGENALDLIQRVTSNDASKLTLGKAQYSCLPNNEGGIIDDLIVYCIEENKIYISEEYKCAAHNCLCGCGNLTITPLGGGKFCLSQISFLIPFNTHVRYDSNLVPHTSS